MANNLVRELRVNKNGVPVYKWVRPAQSASGALQVPPPASTPVPDKAPRGKDICDYLTSQSVGSFGIGNADKVNELSDEHRTRLMEIVQNGSKDVQRLFSNSIQMDGSHLLSMIIETHGFAMKIHDAEGDQPATLALHNKLETVFREFNYNDGWNGDEDQINEAKGKYLAHALGVTERTSLEKMVDYEDYVWGISYETDRIEPALPVIMAANSVTASNRAVSETTISELTGLAEEYPDRVQQMRATILERRTVDLVLLSNVADSPTAALSDGLL